MTTPKHILVAEDEPTDVFLLRLAFTKAEIPVTLHFVRDGEDAVNYLKGEARYADRGMHPLPDLLLLDLKMPRLNGFDVLGWLRQQPGLKRLPVAILSSSRLAQDANRAYELGANSYLVKPCDLEKMFETVKRVREYWLELNQNPPGL